MSALKVKPIVLDADGIFGQLPNGAIINAGGTTNPTWTVGGRGLLFDDGTSTGGTGTVISSLQTIYDSSPTINSSAEIILSSGKDFVIANAANPGLFFKIDSTTGKITVTSAVQISGATSILANLTVSGLINNVDIGKLKTDLDKHIAGEVGYRHVAGDIDVLPISGLPGALNVQDALEQINNKLSGEIANNFTTGYEHIQINSLPFWTIQHNMNTKRAQVSVYDSDFELMIPEKVKILDENTILVAFTSPINGTAIVVLF